LSTNARRISLRVKVPSTCRRASLGNDFGTWKAAFDRFAEAREKSGVRDHRILRPVDDARCVVVDLDFQTASEAENFLAFLQTTVWSSAERPRPRRDPAHENPRAR
jgi:hypothetical protein